MEEKFGIKTKMLMLEELRKKFDASPDFVVTNYKGLKAEELDTLRKELVKSSSRYLVVKNSLAKKTFEELEMPEIDEFLKGEVGIGFVGDVIEASKSLVAFSKGHPAFKLNCAYINGKIENAERLKHLASLPPKEVLLGLVFACMKSPITNFVGVLSGLLRSFVYVVSEIKKKKEDK